MLFDSLPRPNAEITPGVAHLPGAVPLAQQAEWVSRFRGIAKQYAGTPFAMMRPQLKSGQMSVHMLHLGQLWDYQRYRYITEAAPALPKGSAGAGLAFAWSCRPRLSRACSLAGDAGGYGAD